MAPRLIHAWTPYGGRWAVVNDHDHLVDYRISRNDDRSGAVLDGRIIEILPHLSAALVEIGTARPGFLRAAGTVQVGQTVRVRVRAEARAEKGAILQRVPDDTPLRDADPLDDLLTDHPSLSQIISDDDESRPRWGHRLPCHRVPLSPLDDSPFADIVDSLTAPVVTLPCGGRMIIETTAALTAVDIDSAAAAPERANAEAVTVFAQHLRLRNLAGAMVVDFVPQKRKSALQSLVQRLRDAVADDPVPTQVLGSGPLGLVELRRERRRLSLTDRLGGPDGQAIHLLDRLWQAVRHAPPTGPVWTLRVNPSVAEALTRLSDDFRGLEQRTGRRPRLEIDPNRAEDQGAVDT